LAAKTLDKKLAPIEVIM